MANPWDKPSVSGNPWDKPVQEQIVVAKPEQGNMYTQSAEDIQYDPMSGLPLNTSSYGSANPYKKTEKALTTMAGMPVNYGMALAKPVAGTAQLINNVLGNKESNLTLSDLVTGNKPKPKMSNTDNMVNAINQIEQGVNQNSYSPLTKGASLAGDLTNPIYWGAGGAIGNAVNKAGAALPALLRNTATGLFTGAGTGLTNMVDPNSENYAQDKLNNVAINSAIGGALPGLMPVASAVGKFTALTLPSEILGLTTGAGGEAIRQATKAGVNKGIDFIQNMRGQVPTKDVLEAAQSGLQTLKQNRKDAFQQGFQTTQNNQVFLDFKPIEDKFTDVIKNLNVTGVGGVTASKVGKNTLKDVNEIKQVINEWKGKPELHTAEGLDALKRRIDDVYRNDMSNEAKSILSQTRNTVKQTIVKQDPNYAKTMKDYEIALDTEKELEKALGLGDKTAVDTAIKKLQSLTRNNANTSYQYRQELADILKQQSGVDLMPALSGQALNTLTPRGIQKVIPGLTTAGSIGALAASGGATGLGSLAALPFQSPRIVGEAAYKVGQIARPMVNLANSGTPEQRRLAELLLYNSTKNSPSRENQK